MLRKHHEHNEWWWNIMKHQLEKRTKHSWPATTKQNSSETNHLALSKNIRKTPKTIPILRKSWQKSHSLNGKMAIKLWRHRGKSTIFGPNPRAFHPDSIPPLRGKISESCHARTIADLMRISVTSKNRYPTTVTINVICKEKETLCKVTSVVKAFPACMIIKKILHTIFSQATRRWCWEDSAGAPQIGPASSPTTRSEPLDCHLRGWRTRLADLP